MGRQALTDPEGLVGDVRALSPFWPEAREDGPLEEEVRVPEVQVHQGVEVDGAIR